ncbi:MAG: glycosyltransferase family 39 protein [Bryobacteraceae bacterium]|nr:glycosyltransferase family 39 protein [Bryobacteraceae bacterium]
MEAWPVLWALAMGGVLAEAVMPAPAARTWLRWVWRGALAVPMGLGAASLVSFTLIWAGAASRISILLIEALLMTIAGAVLYKRRRDDDPAPAPAHPAAWWLWLLRAAAAFALLLFLVNFLASTAAAPYGEWDASSIWNLRARFLAGGDAWRYAVSPDLNAGLTGASHPGYPLLLSSFIARGWILAGATNTAAPAATAFAASLAAFLLLFAALAKRREESLGLLALLILAASEGWVSQTAVQHADVPLSLLVLAATALLAAALESGWTPRLALLAGLAGGFAAWTKNEGLVALLALLVVALWRGGPRMALWTAAGALPGAGATALLKLFLVRGGASLYPQTPAEAWTMLTDGARWSEVLRGYATAAVELGFAATHPLLLLAAVAFVLRPAEPARWRAALIAALPALALLGAGFGALLVTTANQQWHVGTAVNRLVAQVWPALLFAAMMALRMPGELARPDVRARKSKQPAPGAPPDPVPPPPRRPRQRQRSG